MSILRLTVMDKSIPLKEVSNEIHNNQWIKYISFESNKEMSDLYKKFRDEVLWYVNEDTLKWIDCNFPFIEKLSPIEDVSTYNFMAKLLSLLESQGITNIRLNSICEINPNDWKLKRLYNLEYLVKDVDFFFMTKSTNKLTKQKRTL